MDNEFIMLLGPRVIFGQVFTYGRHYRTVQLDYRNEIGTLKYTVTPRLCQCIGPHTISAEEELGLGMR